MTLTSRTGVRLLPSFIHRVRGIKFCELSPYGDLRSSYPASCIDHLLGGARDRSKALWAGTPEPIYVLGLMKTHRENTRGRRLDRWVSLKTPSPRSCASAPC